MAMHATHIFDFLGTTCSIRRPASGVFTLDSIGPRQATPRQTLSWTWGELEEVHPKLPWMLSWYAVGPGDAPRWCILGEVLDMTTLIAPQITAPDERNLLISIENLHMSADPGSVSFWSSITSEAKTAEGWPYWQSIRKQPFTVTHAWLISKFPNTGSKVIAGMKMGLPDNDLIKLLLSDADCAVDTTDSESIPGDIA